MTALFDMEAKFKEWWNEVGSGIAPLPEHDYYEHIIRILGMFEKWSSGKEKE